MDMQELRALAGEGGTLAARLLYEVIDSLSGRQIDDDIGKRYAVFVRIITADRETLDRNHDMVVAQALSSIDGTLRGMRTENRQAAAKQLVTLRALQGGHDHGALVNCAHAVIELWDDRHEDEHADEIEALREELRPKGGA